jgi:cold shock CspA family protein
MREEGRLWRLNEATGYGLIRPDDGGKDLFLHPRDIANSEARPLEEGGEVRYEVKRSGDRLRPTNVSRSLCYSWRDDCLERLEGKEARHKYYGRLSGIDTIEGVRQQMLKRRHVPGSPHWLTDRLVMTICLACETSAYAVLAANEATWRTGGPALHKACIAG